MEAVYGKPNAFQGSRRQQLYWSQLPASQFLTRLCCRHRTLHHAMSDRSLNTPLTTHFPLWSLLQLQPCTNWVGHLNIYSLLQRYVHWGGASRGAQIISPLSLVWSWKCCSELNSPRIKNPHFKRHLSDWGVASLFVHRWSPYCWGCSRC